MASRQTRKAPRNTTNIVVRNGGPTQPPTQPKQRRNRRKGHNAKAPALVRVVQGTQKRRRPNPARGRGGGRIVLQKITTTLGTVGSNASEAIENELTVLINPSTMKETTGSNSFGPLQIYASTYALYQIRHIRVTLRPLVGDSAVSGTVIRTSWNPTSTPSQTSWSSLGARKHTDTTPGKTGIFTLGPRDLVGPKGGWYKTNTKGDPMLSFAGSIEIHSFGKTMSTYQNAQFTGGLFLAELQTVWAFKDYAQQPGMMNLVKGDDKNSATITTDADGKIQLKVPSTTRLGRSAADTTASEIIWMVTDTVINAGSAVLPPPFSWLLRGGWWFLKRVAGAPVRTGEVTFDVYASINDARAAVPCISTSKSMAAIPIGSLNFQQITPGNTGIGDDIPAIISEPQIMLPEVPLVAFDAVQYQLSTGHGSNEEPAKAYFVAPVNTTQISNDGTGFRISDSEWVMTHNVLHASCTWPFEKFQVKVPVYMRWPVTGGFEQQVIGYAVAASYTANQAPHTLRLSNVLIYTTAGGQAYSYNKNWQFAELTRNAVTTSHVNNYKRTTYSTNHWYVLQFLNLGNITGIYKIGGIQLIGVASQEYMNITNIQHTDNVDISGGLVPSYCSGFKFTVLTSSALTKEGFVDYVQQQDNTEIAEAEYEHMYDLPAEPTCAEDPCPIHDVEEDSDQEDTEEEYDYEDDFDITLQMEPGDHWSDPPLSLLEVAPAAEELYNLVLKKHTE